MGAIECITRSMAGQPKATLGEIIKTQAKVLGIPAPLDDAIAKL